MNYQIKPDDIVKVKQSPVLSGCLGQVTEVTEHFITIRIDDAEYTFRREQLEPWPGRAWDDTVSRGPAHE